jgi:membrane protease subunit (stomatin/prohibitin family)
LKKEIKVAKWGTPKKYLKKKLNRTLPLRAKCKYEIVFGKTTDPSNRSLLNIHCDNNIGR